MGRPGRAAAACRLAIAALHAKAPCAAATDWPQIAALYGSLYRMTPTPVVALNAAAAIAMVSGPLEGLARIDRMQAREPLSGYPWLPAARADLLRRAGRPQEAARQYASAIALVRSEPERRYLERRMREVSEEAWCALAWRERKRKRPTSVWRLGVWFVGPWR